MSFWSEQLIGSWNSVPCFQQEEILAGYSLSLCTLHIPAQQEALLPLSSATLQSSQKHNVPLAFPPSFSSQKHSYKSNQLLYLLSAPKDLPTCSVPPMHFFFLRPSAQPALLTVISPIGRSLLPVLPHVVTYQAVRFNELCDFLQLHYCLFP